MSTNNLFNAFKKVVAGTKKAKGEEGQKRADRQQTHEEGNRERKRRTRTEQLGFGTQTGEHLQ